MLLNPTALAPDFGGVWQLLSMRTPRIYLASRVTVDAEQWLTFILKKVSFKLGSFGRYQEWFRERFLSV